MRRLSKFPTGSQTPPIVPPRAGAQVQCRFKTRCPITLSWHDTTKGYTWTVRARVVNMSRVGACVELREPLARGSCTCLRSENLKLMGISIVRHCVRSGPNYRIRLEFQSPLITSY